MNFILESLRSAKLLALTALGLCAGSQAALADGAEYITPTYVDGLSVRNGVLCWKHSLDADPATVFRSPAMGGQTAQLYFTSATEGSRPVSRTAELDAAANAYWISQAGNVVRQDSNANSTITPTTLATLENTSFLDSSVIVVGNARVFWGETQGEVGNGGKVFWAPVAGGARTLVHDTNPVLSYPVQLCALSDTGVLVLTANGYLTYSAENGGTWNTTLLFTGVESFAVANGRLYYAQRVGSNVDLRSRPLPPGAATSDLHYTVTGAPAPAVREMAADAANIYWHEVVMGTGAIRRCPLAGGSAATLHGAAQGYRISLTLHGGWLYWTGGDHHAIWRVSTAAVPDQIDLAIASMEVVQVVQNAANSVPLVAGKPTFVRLFANIASTNNRTLVANWPMAQIRAYNPATGLELPGSPDSPYNGTRVTLHTGANNRTDANEAFLFRLPSEWSTLPSVQIVANLNPRRVVAETGYGNNTQSVTVSLQRKAPIWIEGTPLSAYRSETFSSYQPYYEEVFERAESLLPVPVVYSSWRGGPPVDKLVAVFDFPPWEHRPIELTSGFERAFWGQRQLITRAIFNSRPAACQALNANYHCVGFYTRDAAGTLLGEAMPVARGLISTMDISSGGPTDFNSAEGGMTLAHEIAHNYFRLHLPVGGAAGPYAGQLGTEPYPYPVERYNDTSSLMLGFDNITDRSIPATNAAGVPTAELMGYLRPQWISDFTYKGVLDALSNLPAGAEVPRPAPSGDGTVWMLGGVLTAEGNQLSTPIAVPDAGARAELAAQITKGDTARYKFRISHADGSSYTVAAAAADSADGLTPFTMLIGSMDPDPDAVKVGVEPIPGGGEISYIKGGGAPPDFTIIEPAGGETFTVPFLARWTASDPEGNTVRTMVRYSHDGGTSWLTLADELPLQELLINPAELPGGTDCRFQFIASDGIQPTVKTSASFTIPSKAPVPYITLRNSGGAQHGLSTLRATAGERMRLEGRGQDLEDGLAKSYKWTVTNGFRTYGGASSVLELPPIQPGTWNVSLTVADEQNNTATATATLIVDSLHFASTSAVITLDGLPDEAAWLADTHPQVISYGSAAGRAPAEFRMVHNGSNLCVAASGLSRGANAAEFIGLIFDLNASGDSYPQPDDVRFDIFADGRINRLVGNGTDYTLLATPGISARVAAEPGSDSWSFEAEIPVSLLGGWHGQNVKINVSHFHRNTIGDDYAWLGLATNEWNWPARWANATFDEDAYDPTDADGNGIADAWERAHYGYSGISATADDDGDGQSNGSEFAANTDPLDPASRFFAELFTTPGDIKLQWQSSLDRSYFVWRSTDLGNWTYAAGPIAGTGAIITHIFPASSDQRQFYKISARWNR